MQLTDLAIRTLKAPDRGQKTYFDDLLTGFGVRISQGGTKTFVLMHGRERKLTTIGRVGIIKLKEARERAKEYLAKETLDPNIETSLRLFGDAWPGRRAHGPLPFP